MFTEDNWQHGYCNKIHVYIGTDQEFLGDILNLVIIIDTDYDYFSGKPRPSYTYIMDFTGYNDLKQRGNKIRKHLITTSPNATLWNDFPNSSGYLYQRPGDHYAVGLHKADTCCIVTYFVKLTIY
jgi:hypothetical protein